MSENRIFYKSGILRPENCNDEKRAILIGAGESGSECPVIKPGDTVIALDGGLTFCVEKGIEPDSVIGDFDSLPEEKHSLLEQYPADRILRLPAEKDDTDMLAAIKFAKEKGIRQFVIYGGMGGRLSHTIANIQCLVSLKKEGITGILIGESGNLFVLKNETCVFDQNERGYVSVFAYSENASGITLKNLKYELQDAQLSASFPLGVSNEFIGEAAEITVEDGILLVITEG